jgi:hypothetical protein
MEESRTAYVGPSLEVVRPSLSTERQDDEEVQKSYFEFR